MNDLTVVYRAMYGEQQKTDLTGLLYTFVRTEI